jgi:hypothetical protein
LDHNISKIHEPETAKSNLRSSFVELRKVQIWRLHGWVAASTVDCLPRWPNIFIEVSVIEFARWLFEYPESRVDVFIVIETDHRVDFVTFFASILPQMRHIDINLILAVQAPVLASCVSSCADAHVVCQRWFQALCDEIFANNLKSPLAYFKIMNQSSITIKNEITQDTVIIAARRRCGRQSSTWRRDWSFQTADLVTVSAFCVKYLMCGKSYCSSRSIGHFISHQVVHQSPGASLDHPTLSEKPGRFS